MNFSALTKQRNSKKISESYLYISTSNKLSFPCASINSNNSLQRPRFINYSAWPWIMQETLIFHILSKVGEKCYPLFRSYLTVIWSIDAVSIMAVPADLCPQSRYFLNFFFVAYSQQNLFFLFHLVSFIYFLPFLQSEEIKMALRTQWFP